MEQGAPSNADVLSDSNISASNNAVPVQDMLSNSSSMVGGSDDHRQLHKKLTEVFSHCTLNLENFVNKTQEEILNIHIADDQG